ncbi:MAG: phage major capsid protein [Sciscionella sp.]
MYSQIQLKAMSRDLAEKVRVVMDNKNMSAAHKNTILDVLQERSDEIADGFKNLDRRKAFDFGADAVDESEFPTHRPGDPMDTQMKAFSSNGYPIARNYGASDSLCLGTEIRKGLMEAGRKRAPFGAQIATKTLPTGALGDFLAGVPGVLPELHMPPIPAGRESFAVETLFPITGMTGLNIDYFQVQQNGAGADAGYAAAVVPEGSLKPQAAVSIVPTQVSAETIAVLQSISNQAFHDYQGLLEVVTMELQRQIIECVNDQLLNSSGSASGGVSTFKGLLQQPAIQTYTAATGETMFDSAILAAAKLRSSGFYVEADSIVVHPDNFATAMTAKSTGSGEYLVGHPAEATASRWWGSLNVVQTTSIAKGTAVIGRFQDSAFVAERAPLTIELGPYGSNANGSDWQTNMLTLRVERRMAFLVTRPQAFAKITLNTTE